MGARVHVRGAPPPTIVLGNSQIVRPFSTACRGFINWKFKEMFDRGPLNSVETLNPKPKTLNPKP